MLAANKEVKHPVKNKLNPHFKNRYADLTAVLDAIIPVYLKHGLVLTQVVDEYGLTTMVMHKSGQWLSGNADVPVDKTGPQAFGSGLTYMRRYALSAMAGVASEEDDDAEGATDRDKKKTTKKETVKENW